MDSAPTVSPFDPIARCQATLRFEPTDRAPRYMPAIACSVASAILGRPVSTGTGSLHFAEVSAWAKGEAAHAEFEERLLEDLVAIHRALGVDVLRMPWRLNRRPAAMPDERTVVFGDPDGLHEVWRYCPETADFGCVRRGSHRTAPEIRLQREVEEGERHREGAAELARAQIDGILRLRAKAGGDFFVIGCSAGIAAGLGDEDLMLLALEPELMARRCMLQARTVVAIAEALARTDLPKVILGGGDLAGNDGLMYSPDRFRRVLLPAYVWAMDRCRELGVHYVFRSDGSLWPLTDMIFSEAACGDYGEADRDAGMTVAALRRRFGHLIIWGNVSSKTLYHGRLDDVRRECRDVLDESAGLGYFHGCSNAIIHDTPAENARAMFEVV
ncbi:MAG: hypothetical protein J7M14_03555 [Planctomycetes bacterium]|nr:hypothetical protein [Planctomycetota bacterium]